MLSLTYFIRVGSPQGSLTPLAESQLVTAGSALVQLILTCFNSGFMTNDFYLPKRHTSQLICIYYLWAVLSQKSYHSLALWALHRVLNEAFTGRTWSCQTWVKKHLTPSKRTHMHHFIVYSCKRFMWAPRGHGSESSCTTSTLWRFSRDSFPGFSLIQSKQLA